MKKLSLSVIARRMRLIATGSLNHLLFSTLLRKRFKAENAIVICGSIRSGSTWLAEMLSALDHHIQLFEPLHPKYVSEVKAHIPSPNWYVPADKKWPEGEALFRRILAGRLVNPWILSQVTPGELPGAKQLVIKFVRANLMLPWLSRLEGLRAPVLVIRHPCGVISSQLNKQWPPGKQLLLSNSYLDNYPEIRRQCQRLSEPEELAALAWCLRYHAPLYSPAPQRFVLVSYEALVRNGAAELRRIYQAWGETVPAAAEAQIAQPSDTSTKDSMIRQGKDPLAGWQHKLTGTQIANILNVLKIFGMEFYSEALEPDYQVLRQFGCSNNNER